AFETDDVGELAARRALARHPDAFLGESPAELAALRSRRATFLAEVELPAQALSPTRGRALLGLVPPVALGALAALTFFEHFDGPAVLVAPWATLLGILVALHTSSATLALLGMLPEKRTG